MSDFLRNIIARHSLREMRDESIHIVEPRLKSRFEADLSTGPSLSQHGSGIDPVAAYITEEISRDQHVPPNLRSNSRKENPEAGRVHTSRS